MSRNHVQFGSPSLAFHQHDRQHWTNLYNHVSHDPVKTGLVLQVGRIPTRLQQCLDAIPKATTSSTTSSTSSSTSSSLPSPNVSVAASASASAARGVLGNNLSIVDIMDSPHAVHACPNPGQSSTRPRADGTRAPLTHIRLTRIDHASFTPPVTASFYSHRKPQIFLPYDCAGQPLQIVTAGATSSDAVVQYDVPMPISMPISISITPPPPPPFVTVVRTKSDIQVLETSIHSHNNRLTALTPFKLLYSIPSLPDTVPSHVSFFKPIECGYRCEYGYGCSHSPQMSILMTSTSPMSGTSYLLTQTLDAGINCSSQTIVSTPIYPPSSSSSSASSSSSFRVNAHTPTSHPMLHHLATTHGLCPNFDLRSPPSSLSLSLNQSQSINININTNNSGFSPTFAPAVNVLQLLPSRSCPYEVYCEVEARTGYHAVSTSYRRMPGGTLESLVRYDTRMNGRVMSLFTLGGYGEVSSSSSSEEKKKEKEDGGRARPGLLDYCDTRGLSDGDERKRNPPLMRMTTSRDAFAVHLLYDNNAGSSSSSRSVFDSCPVEVGGSGGREGSSGSKAFALAEGIGGGGIVGCASVRVVVNEDEGKKRGKKKEEKRKKKKRRDMRDDSDDDDDDDSDSDSDDETNQIKIDSKSKSKSKSKNILFALHLTSAGTIYSHALLEQNGIEEKESRGKIKGRIMTVPKAFLTKIKHQHNNKHVDESKHIHNSNTNNTNKDENEVISLTLTNTPPSPSQSNVQTMSNADLEFAKVDKGQYVLPPSYPTNSNINSNINSNSNSNSNSGLGKELEFGMDFVDVDVEGVGGFRKGPASVFESCGVVDTDDDDDSDDGSDDDSDESDCFDIEIDAVNDKQQQKKKKDDNDKDVMYLQARKRSNGSSSNGKEVKKINGKVESDGVGFVSERVCKIGFTELSLTKVFDVIKKEDETKKKKKKKKEKKQQSKSKLVKYVIDIDDGIVGALKAEWGGWESKMK